MMDFILGDLYMERWLLIRTKMNSIDELKSICCHKQMLFLYPDEICN
jgi:hypothetical protein